MFTNVDFKELFVLEFPGNNSLVFQVRTGMVTGLQLSIALLLPTVVFLLPNTGKVLTIVCES
jgi:hypothetical protein